MESSRHQVRAIGCEQLPHTDFGKVSPAPGTEAGNPTGNIPAIFLIIRAKHFPKSGLLIKLHKEHDSSRGDQHNHERKTVRSAKHDPQTHPASEEADIHWIPYVSIKTHHHQPLRRNEGSGRSAARAPEIPDASQRD